MNWCQRVLPSPWSLRAVGRTDFPCRKAQNLAQVIVWVHADNLKGKEINLFWSSYCKYYDNEYTKKNPKTNRQGCPAPRVFRTARFWIKHFFKNGTTSVCENVKACSQTRSDVRDACANGKLILGGNLQGNVKAISTRHRKRQKLAALSAALRNLNDFPPHSM